MGIEDLEALPIGKNADGEEIAITRQVARGLLEDIQACGIYLDLEAEFWRRIGELGIELNENLIK